MIEFLWNNLLPSNKSTAVGLFLIMLMIIWHYPALNTVANAQTNQSLHFGNLNLKGMAKYRVPINTEKALRLREVTHTKVSKKTNQDTSLPNILWLTVEDINPNLGAYGDTYAHTPNIDAFSQNALRYDVAWSTSPVCSTARTAIITGMYPPSLGGHNHRSQVGLPEHIKMYPQMLRDHGYYVTNNAKEDYNVLPFDGDPEIWHASSNDAHYRNRPDEDTPFFAIFNSGLSHGSQTRQRTELPYHDPDKAPVPAFHPDTPEVRREWAQYYHSITRMDQWFGEMIQELEEEGLMENTIIFFYGDHGGGMNSYKQLNYNRGLHVPLIIYVPEKYWHLAPEEYVPGGFTRRPVEFVDLSPTLLSLIGVEPPEWMDGKAFMGPYEEDPRQYIFGSRGRMDERQDMVRSVRDDRYIYIRNYMPHLKHGYFSKYGRSFATPKIWQELYNTSELVPPQTYVWESKPAEELYDLISDPQEVHNLADSPYHQDVLDRMRTVHRRHMFETRDVHFLPESEMHRRAKGTSAPIWEVDGDEATTIYEMAQDPERYPMERIFAVAELAVSRSFHALPKLQIGLNDLDSAIRYWSALGILIRGQRAFDATDSKIRRTLEDDNPVVQVVAAEILATYGNDDDLHRALQRLVELARPDEYGAYVAIEALNSVENLGEKAKSIESAILANEELDPVAPWRGANEFVIRLLPGYEHPGEEALRRNIREDPLSQ